jgi:excisionase family DNA binding protein
MTAEITKEDWVEATVAGLPALITAEEAATVLRTTKRTLYRWCAMGRIASVKRPGGEQAAVLIPKSALVAYLRGLEAA